MSISHIIMVFVLGAVVACAAPVPSASNNIDLIHKLLLAPTAVDRINLLNGSDFVYNFNAPPDGATTTGEGGRTVNANRKTFPALIGTGVAMNVGFIGPCGFNTPHIHPRSSEINIIVEGRLGTMFIPENGVKPIGINYLDQYQMTVFPQGATHLEFNPDCTNAVFVAGFGSEDPGVEQVAQALFSLDPAVVQAALGVETINGADITTFKNRIPPNVALGVQQCLDKCGISRK